MSEIARLKRRIEELEGGRQNDERGGPLASRASFKGDPGDSKRPKEEVAEHDGSSLPIVTARTVDISRIDRVLTVAIASFLGSSDLVTVGLTCRQFGSRLEGQQLSLVDQVAKLAFETSATDAERAHLPKYIDESHLSLLNLLELHQRPLGFDNLIGLGIEHYGDRSTIVNDDIRAGTAASTCLVRAGRHYAGYTIKKTVGLWDSYFQSGVTVGVRSMRATFRGNVYACHYSCHDGIGIWSDGEESYFERDWEGKEAMDNRAGSCEVGLLLDLDEGSLAVYKNNRRLGVMKNGLAGEYCFCATLSETEESVSIMRKSNPHIQQGAP